MRLVEMIDRHVDVKALAVMYAPTPLLRRVFDARYLLLVGAGVREQSLLHKQPQIGGCELIVASRPENIKAEIDIELVTLADRPDQGGPFIRPLNPRLNRPAGYIGDVARQELSQIVP